MGNIILFLPSSSSSQHLFEKGTSWWWWWREGGREMIRWKPSLLKLWVIDPSQKLMKLIILLGKLKYGCGAASAQMWFPSCNNKKIIAYTCGNLLRSYRGRVVVRWYGLFTLGGRMDVLISVLFLLKTFCSVAAAPPIIPLLRKSNQAARI